MLSLVYRRAVECNVRRVREHMNKISNLKAMMFNEKEENKRNLYGWGRWGCTDKVECWKINERDENGYTGVHGCIKLQRLFVTFNQLPHWTLTWRLLVYWELTRLLCFLKNALLTESSPFLERGYAVNPTTWNTQWEKTSVRPQVDIHMLSLSGLYVLLEY